MSNDERKLRSKIAYYEDELFRSKHIRQQEKWHYALMELRRDLQKIERSKRS